MRQAEFRIAVSNTGPLISAFQCGRMDILRQLYDAIHIPLSVLTELTEHGAGSEIRDLVRVGFLVVHDDFTEEERGEARAIAEAIVKSPKSRNKNPSHHLSEAETTALASRKDLAAIEVLLDESIAREVAGQRGVPVIGFPGILIRACKQGLILPEEAREALSECRRQGTHYGAAFIERIYNRLWEEVQ
jgi:predicted nucleic acid-binding protein